MLLFMPDSPKYLIAESKTPEARKALQWFRGPQFDVDEELRQISESHEEESKIGSVTFKELLSKRVYWQPFLIAMFGMFGQQFCGINVVFFYQQTIFEKARSSIDPSKSRKLLMYKLEKSTNDVKYFLNFLTCIVKWCLSFKNHILWGGHWNQSDTNVTKSPHLIWYILLLT